MGFGIFKHNPTPETGQMLFLTSPEGEVLLSSELRGAIYSDLSMYAYRNPGDFIISYGISDSYELGIQFPGFVIAPFNPELPPITIPFSNRKTKGTEIPLEIKFPFKSTSETEFLAEVEAIKQEIIARGYGKTVASRVLVKNSPIDPLEAFSKLCKAYKDAFVFLFFTPVTGCWIGASPELLLQSSGGILKTMSLAGTRKSNSLSEWDIKNIEEQEMVTDYLYECFEKHSLIPERGKTFTKIAGPVEHLCTPVRARNTLTGKDSLSLLLQDMSPTPALCGLPKQQSMEAISRLESFSRGCYGGFCGPFKTTDDFSFNVNLRCAMLSPANTAYFAGAGITSKSTSSQEWEETEMKISTLSKILQNK